MKRSARILQQSSSTSAAAATLAKGPAALQTSVSRPAPGLFCLSGLRSLPYWTQYNNNKKETVVAYQDPQVTAAVRHLESSWQGIWKEYQTAQDQSSLPPSDYQAQTEHSKLHEGVWDWHSYMRKGTLDSSFPTTFPYTTQVLQELQQSQSLFTGTPFGYAFFSTLHPDSRIHPHTSPMNLRLRIHLGLDIPDDGNANTCGISVATVQRSWVPGKALVLDDSFAHAVWNESPQKKQRVVLLVDIWHPDISLAERQEIQTMFQGAAEKGWLSPSS